MKILGSYGGGRDVVCCLRDIPSRLVGGQFYISKFLTDQDEIMYTRFARPWKETGREQTMLSFVVRIAWNIPTSGRAVRYQGLC